MASKHHQEDPWAGFVDVLSNMLVVVVFLVIILGLAIFALSQQITKQAVQQALEQHQQEKKDQQAPKPPEVSEAAKPADGAAEKPAAESAAAPAAAAAATETPAAQAAKPVETAKAEAAGAPPSDPAKAGKEDADKGAQDEGTVGPAEQPADVSKAQESAEQSKGSAGERQAGYAQRVRASDEIEGNSNLTVRSANVDSEQKLEVASEEIKPSYGKIEVTSSDAFLKLTFAKGNFRIDESTSGKLKDYLGTSPVAKQDTIEIRAIAQSTVGSVSEARRIAYYRAMEMRSQLIQAGFDSTKIMVRVRESASPEDADVVQVFKKS